MSASKKMIFEEGYSYCAQHDQHYKKYCCGCALDIDFSFWPDRKGMKISAVGLLKRCACHLEGVDGAYDFSLEQLLEHLQELGNKFYAGDISVVDDFLQLYCLDEGRKK